MIRLFVIEDHLTLVLSSLRFMFRPQRDGIALAGYARTPEETIKTADPLTFDLFILDLFLPGLRPIENIRALRKHFPDKPILIFTSEKSSAWKVAMMEEGAAAFVSKDASREELAYSIKKAASGEFLITGKTGEQKCRDTSGQLSEVITTQISPVVAEIAKLLSQGYKHKEIADHMGVSRSLVEKILNQLQKKLQVTNTYELIKILSEKGLI